MNTHPSFDADEQEIVGKLVVEGAEPGSPAGAVPAEETPPGAVPAQTPVPTPAPTSAPTDPTATPAPTPAPLADGSPAATPAPTAAPEPQGNVKAALRASRQQEKRLRSELERVQQENAALREGKGPVDTELTEEELETLKADFPAQYKLYVRNQQLSQQLEENLQHQREQQPSDWEPPVYKPEVQEVIDQVPTLLDWQHDRAKQDHFARAIEYDKSLLADPDWKTRPVVERFAEAARRADAALSPRPAQPTTPAPSAAPAAATTTDPAAALAAATLEGPKGISDFRGGASPSAPSLDFNRMTDQQILSALRPED